ncbi:MAG: rhodanese-like domain-containing protein [Deltaproteobacteria bacterium]|nr:rhodanese-like domain-containing protein [Deltaproteobacteria bacterium]
MSSEWVKIALGILAALAVVYLVVQRSGDVAGSEARQLVSAGARLVDVRSPGEFASGHLEGAINVPVQELGQRMGELEPKSAPIVIYCLSGTRSAQASRMLKSAGFAQVHNLGAMSRW